MTTRTLTVREPKPWVYVAERRDGTLVAINSGTYPNKSFFTRYAKLVIKPIATEAEYLAYLKTKPEHGQ